MDASWQEACREIIERLMLISSPTEADVSSLKREVASRYKLIRVPSNVDLIRSLRHEEVDKLAPLLRLKAVRTISGVATIAVMVKPWPCPQRNPCAYCPGGPSYGVPQSYTGHEPAALRALEHKFDPYSQVAHRVRQLEAIGHVVDKVELIILGGTFTALPPDYQEHFVKRCLDALNGQTSQSLDEAKRLSEASKIRNSGMTIETRPDWAKEHHVDRLLSLGITRVELGVQTVYDDVYELVNRGHTVDDVIEATRILKDSGLAIIYHMMPGLPGSSFERDLEAFRRIFFDQSFKPDMLKIYPCLVIEGTKLYEWWKRGSYEPYSTEEAVELLVNVAKMIPPWVRVMRVQRDIPAPLIVAGVKRGDLRDLVERRLKELDLECRCIRCREVGHRLLKDGVKPSLDYVRINVLKERASEGEDVFIAVEDPVNDVLIGYLRLRMPSEKAHRPEVVERPSSIVRELHVYGPLVPVGSRSPQAWQHKGYGAALLEEAERMSREEYDRKRILILSALGVKRYYTRFGYRHKGPYMMKELN